MQDLAGHDRAIAHLLGGDLDAAHRAHQQALETSQKPGSAHPIASAVGVRIAYLRDDDAAAERYADSEALETAFRDGEPQTIGLIAGWTAPFYQARGRVNDAWALRRRALEMVDGAETSYWLLDQMAGSSEDADVSKAREILERASRNPERRTAPAHFKLFESRVALRDGRRDAARALAREAAEQFNALGRPWERAQALEVAGELARALAIYERLGCSRDAARVTRVRRRARHRPSTTQLTQRELEVARLAADGKSNRAIAEALFIGERTVETHITAIFERFRLSSRKELGGLLDRMLLRHGPTAQTG